MFQQQSKPESSGAYQSSSHPTNSYQPPQQFTASTSQPSFVPAGQQFPVQQPPQQASQQQFTQQQFNQQQQFQQQQQQQQFQQQQQRQQQFQQQQQQQFSQPYHNPGDGHGNYVPNNNNNNRF